MPLKLIQCESCTWASRHGKNSVIAELQGCVPKLERVMRRVTNHESAGADLVCVVHRAQAVGWVSITVQMSSSSPFATSLCHVPDAVLSSCVLPLLDTKSLLHHARCCHLFLAAGSAAWAHSLVAVSLDDLASASMLRSLPLRRADLSVRDDGVQCRSVVVQRLVALPNACKLVSLRIGGVRGDPLDWARIIAMHAPFALVDTDEPHGSVLSADA